MGLARNIEARVFRALRRDPPLSKLHRLAFWMLVIYLALMPGRMLPGSAGQVFSGLSLFAFILLLILCVPLVWRWIFARFLWKLRNRLIMTYLLMALTPVVLFALLAMIALYLFSGQFAFFASIEDMQAELELFAAENRALATRVAHDLQRTGSGANLGMPERGDTAHGGETHELKVAAFQDGKPITIFPARYQASDITQIPSWIPSDGFQGLVLDNRKLYLRAVYTDKGFGHVTTVISSIPVDKAAIDQVAHGIGRIGILPNHGVGGEITSEELRKDSISGGSLREAHSFYDIPIIFYGTLPTTDWATGKSHDSPTIVTSRPSLLYQRLFIASLQIAAFVQDVLIGVAIFFGLLELIAFIMAVRLNRTITRSVSGLYDATVEIDKGNLAHRIQVTRNDQLAALSRSFNRMSYSLERLLAEQREKERLQNELEIAQEVQSNLFPRGVVSLPMLDLHGVCYPARTVSGDYYDFLVFGDAELGLALGDISGKGISAALLMATLHSAVRAYRFAGEDLVLAKLPVAAGPIRVGSNGDSGIDPFLEPARILTQLNRHLYRSTQPEKYATLFLAHYDGAEQQLTYSCGGQLPPLILRRDDSVTRLDCGGTVVGLLENPVYDQGIEKMHEGDILIAYSDGVTEPENDFGEFGEERLLEVVRRHRHKPLDAISEQVMQSLRNWIGGQEQPDDITLVLARQL